MYPSHWALQSGPQDVLHFIIYYLFFVNFFYPQFHVIQLVGTVLSHRCNSHRDLAQPATGVARQGNLGLSNLLLTRMMLGQLCAALWVSQWDWTRVCSDAFNRCATREGSANWLHPSVEFQNPDVFLEPKRLPTPALAALGLMLLPKLLVYSSIGNVACYLANVTPLDISVGE